MYQFSLNSFILLFKKALNEKPSSALERRIGPPARSSGWCSARSVAASSTRIDSFGMHFTRHLAAEDADESHWNYYFGLRLLTDLAVAVPKAPRTRSGVHQPRDVPFRHVELRLSEGTT